MADGQVPNYGAQFMAPFIIRDQAQRAEQQMLMRMIAPSMVNMSQHRDNMQLQRDLSQDADERARESDEKKYKTVIEATQLRVDEKFQKLENEIEFLKRDLKVASSADGGDKKQPGGVSTDTARALTHNEPLERKKEALKSVNEQIADVRKSLRNPSDIMKTGVPREEAIQSLGTELESLQNDSLNLTLDIDKIESKIKGVPFTDPRTARRPTPMRRSLNTQPTPIVAASKTGGWKPEWDAEYERWKTENGIPDDRHKDYFRDKKLEGY